MSFDFSLVPTGLPIGVPAGATGVPAGGETAAPQTGTGTVSGFGDFASLLSVMTAPASAATAPQDGMAATAAPSPASVAETTQPLSMPVNALLLQAQLPAADSTVAVPPLASAEMQDPQAAAQAVLPPPVAAETVVEIPTEIIMPQAAPTQPKPVDVPAAKAADSQTAVPAAPSLQVKPQAEAERVQASAPIVKTADAKAVKTSTASNDSDKTAVEADTTSADEATVVPEAVVSLAAVVMPAVTAPVSQPAATAAAPATDQTALAKTTPPPVPAAQDQATQNQRAEAAEDVDASDTAAPKGQATSKFASLLSVPASAAKPAAPVQPDSKAAAPASQLDTASVATKTVQAQATQAQTSQPQTNEATVRKLASAPVENTADMAATPSAAAPSGFSLVSTAVAADTGYTPAPTSAAPAASLLSQTAVDNLNALSVQINRRHVEGATKFTMELHPADLGKVDVALSIGRDGKMTAHMTFDSEMTAATFSAHESELRQQLRDTGLQLSDDALSFSTRQKTDAVAQAQAHTVNASGRSADDSASGNSSSQQQQNTFTQADSQQGQHRPNSQHLAQLASRQAAADQAAADADLEALNSAIDASAARLKYRPSSSRLALDLSV